MPFLVVALCLAPTASAKKYLQSEDEYHISHQFYTRSICLLQRVLMNWSIMSPVQTPGYWSFIHTVIDIQPCGWGKQTFVFVIDRYVTFHHRSSLLPACKVCSKQSWSCMGTHGSTMLAAPLKWDWEKDETRDCIPLWTTPPDVNVVCMELT